LKCFLKYYVILQYNKVIGLYYVFEINFRVGNLAEAAKELGFVFYFKSNW